MRRAGAIAAGAAALGLVATLAAAQKPTFNRRTGLYEPPLAELARAAERGDRAELARCADRIGPARLAAAMRGADQEIALAALEGALTLPGSARLMEAVSPLLAGPDVIAERAALTLGRMLDGAEPREIADWDVPPDAVARACGALVDLAARDAAAVNARLAALEALAESSVHCRPPAKLAALLRHASPDLRRAAALALAPAEGTGAALQAALADTDPRVAAAAGAAVCRQLARTGFRGTSAPPPAWHKLVLADGTPVEDALEMLPCLARSPDAADKKALGQLARGRPGPLRDRAHELSR